MPLIEKRISGAKLSQTGIKVAPAAAGGPSTHYTDEAYKLAYSRRAAASFLASNGFRNDRTGVTAGFHMFRNDQEAIDLYTTSNEYNHQ